MGEIRQLPEPPRCRGIPLGNGDYTGCLYGYGDLTPFSGPCDCPTCNGSGFEGPLATTLPHMDFGDPECCGCLDAVFRGYDADITCNECGVVVRTVLVTDLERTLDEMELTLNVSSEMCPKCGRVNLFPGFSKILVYTCKGCGEGISVPDDADTGGV